MKKIIIIIIAILCLIRSAISADSNTPFDINEQPKIIQSFINDENNSEKSKELISLIQLLDEVYGNTYERLKNGGKITIFIDPAHGQLNGKWSGYPTGRYSADGLSEEVYSLKLARVFYKHLSGNPHIKVVSTDDHFDAIRGKRDDYGGISFRTTIKNAYNARAQMIISQHLNNVRYSVKATGTSNISGIHIVYDRRGARYLEKITQVHKGFLTLYNKLDVSGFSKQYALDLKEELITAGLKANNWQRGAVADDRFTYFIDFPISLIYETGFISNPDDLSKIDNPVMQEKIARAQYDALLDSLKSVFGVDISGTVVTKTNDNASLMDLTLIKLSRIAIYYMREGRATEACCAIDLMNRHYGTGKFRDLLSPYREIKTTLARSERLYYKSQVLHKKRERNSRRRRNNLRQASKTLTAAMNITRSKNYYKTFYNKYHDAYRDIVTPNWRPRPGTSEKNEVARTIDKAPTRPVRHIDRHYVSTTAEKNRPIIFVYDDHETLWEALKNSLNPDEALMRTLHQSFLNAHVTEKIRVRRWSRTKKRNISTWRETKKRFTFSPGIYIVGLDGNLQVESAEKVSKIHLNPEKYQNHLYLKNSAFTNATRGKTL